MSAGYIYETFDVLFKTLFAQGNRVKELEARLADLETRLAAKPATAKEKDVEQATSSTASPGD